MKKRNLIINIIIALIFLTALFLIIDEVKAITLEVGLGYGVGTGLGTQDIRITIAKIIRAALGFLGIIAVIVIIYGGALFLTSGGDSEKINKAKKLLINALIGLLIILTSFTIASFVLNTLIQATGVGVVGPPGPPGPPAPSLPPGFCPDPIPTSLAPYICSLSPTHGKKGDLVTIKGGKFLDYDAKTSHVTFRKGSDIVEATIVLCQGKPAWTKTQIVVEVPEQLTYVATGPNIWKVNVSTANGNSEDKTTGALITTNEFTLEEGQPGPGIACIVPASGPEQTNINVYGKRFGIAQSELWFMGNDKDGTDDVKATVINSWSEEQIVSKVPIGAIRGDVKVKNIQGVYSNGYNFDVTCQQGSDCSTTNCCTGGYCLGISYCLGGPGQSCFGTCTDSGCRPDLFCDSNCICQPRGLGSPCDGDLIQTGCQRDDNKCSQGFYCSTTSNCTCQYLPEITEVIPNDGAPGNYITILGHGFGSILNSTTKVIFLGGDVNNDGKEEGDSDDQEAILPTGCGTTDIWTDSQVIIEIPTGAVDGPLKLINSDGLFDITNDDDGWQRDFDVNAIVRPGLCQVEPKQGEVGTKVKLSGKNFGISKDKALIGGQEFDDKNNWLWENLLIENLRVPNIFPASLPVQVKVGAEISNPYKFTILPPTIRPIIASIDPTFGPTGQYVTITGNYFGNQPGTVRFYNGNADIKNWATADITFPKECSGSYWQNNQIIVKVPAAATLGNSPTSKIVVISAAGLESNIVDFNHCILNAVTCPLKPGICRVMPEIAPPLYPGVTLYGENFGTFGAQSKVNFWDNQSAPDTNLNLYWTTNKVGRGEVRKAPMTVPSLAKTGPVQLINQNGILSNKINFTVADCRESQIPCSSGTICCPKDGACQLPSDCLIPPSQICTYSWSFTTGKIKEILAPQVIEDVICEEDVQSPTPWMDSDSNCKNAQISVRFKQGKQVADLDPKTLTVDNIIVRKCNTGPNYEDTLCQTIVSGTKSYIQLIYSNRTDKSNVVNGFVMDLDRTQSDELEPGTWYKVTLKSNYIFDSGIKSVDGILLDGNFDGIPGDDYSWHFRVINSIESCAINKVVVTPREALMTLITDIQNYNAFALAPNCNILNGNDYDWNWYKVYSDGFRESADCSGLTTTENKKYCKAKITERDELPLVNNILHYVDPLQTASPVSQGWTYVGAEVFWNQPIHKFDDNNKLTIDLDIPEIEFFYPTNGLVRPEVDTYVTIYGSNFGETQGTSQVLFGDVPAQLADCVNVWTDEVIKVKVPKPQMIRAESEKIYNLPTPEIKDGMILYYDFEDQSNVTIEDKVGNYDGEIKGSPQRVKGQFGQTILLNGVSDYIKIPNNLENLGRGSIEFWLKPSGSEERQTIFSLVNNKGDLFTLDISGIKEKQINLTIKDHTNTTVYTPIVYDAWNHFVYTFDGEKYNFYLNGIKFYPAVGGALIYYLTENNSIKEGFLNAISAKTNILLGAQSDKNNNISKYFKGALDNFAIYNRVLTEEEVMQKYGLGKGQGLLLNFEEDGTKFTDSSANNVQEITIKDPTKNFRVAEGKYGKAVTFNKDNSIKIKNDKLIFSNELTIEGWFKINDTKTTQRIISGHFGDIGLICGKNPLLFCAILNQANESERKVLSATRTIPSDNLNLNSWNYFAVVFDGQKGKLYLNGAKNEFSLNNERIAMRRFWGEFCIGGYNRVLYDATEGRDYIECVPDFSGFLDQIAIYSRALSDAEIYSRMGTKDEEFIKVITARGEDTSDFNNDGQKQYGEYFKFSDYLYPFLCSLEPEFGLKGTRLTISGDNLGDSNKTTYQGTIYGVGSYIYFDRFIPAALEDKDIIAWVNKELAIINPYDEVENNPEIPVYVSIDPYSEPYIDSDRSGSYTEGEKYADINPDDKYNKTLYNLEYINEEANGTQSLLLTTEDKLKSNTLPFYLPPVITSIAPDNGPVKQWVTIRGYNFGQYVEGKSKVFFNKNQEASFPPLPCENYWTNTQIIVVVPDGAVTGDVYLVTGKNLESNRVKYTVNNKPLGPGLCQIIPSEGNVNTKVIVRGDRFGQLQETSDLIFTDKRTAGISEWTNTNIMATVPIGAESGNVIVSKVVSTGSVCAGFHIGPWCPSGKYDILSQTVESNPLYFDVLPQSCGSTGMSLIGTDSAKIAGFPIQPYDEEKIASYANVGVMASDGTYLYTTSYYIWGNKDANNPYNNIYKIGTGYNNTIAGKIYQKYKSTISPGFWTLSMTYHKDGNIYIGRGKREVDAQGNTENSFIYRLVFDKTNSTYSLAGDVKLEEPLYTQYAQDKYIGEANDIFISSNGQYIFNVGAIYSQGYVIDGYRIKIFESKPAPETWRLVKKFEILSKNLFYARGYFGIVVDENIIYLIHPAINPTGKIVAIDWRNEKYIDDWPMGKSYYLIDGQYDWLNRTFWVGEMAGSINIHQYLACPSVFCRSNKDCDACGQGKSECFNGYCSPYIRKFSPLNGAIGTWVTLEGCYFGCEPGQVYFWGKGTGQNDNLLDNVAYFPFNHDANDYSGNNNNGILKFGAEVANKELILNGTDQYVEITNKSNFNFDNTSQFTLSVWFKTGVKKMQMILTKLGVRYSGYELRLSSLGQLEIYIISNFNTDNYLAERTNTANYNDNNWHQAVLTYDGASKADGLKIYIDGSEKETRVLHDILTGSIKNDQPLQIGKRPYLEYSLFNGSIDEVRIYNKALTNSEVSSLYAMGRNPSLGDFYNKQGLTIYNPACPLTWRCSPDGSNDQVVVELPNKNILPNMDCPAGDCPPVNYDTNDAVDGPIKIVTAYGLEDTTLHIPNEPANKLSPVFDVNSINGPRICNLIPEYGNRGITVKVIGENLGEAPTSQDFISFEPTLEAGNSLKEPFFDQNFNFLYDFGELFIDIIDPGIYNMNLNRQDFTFKIKQYLGNIAGCPLVDGWSSEKICFSVPKDIQNINNQISSAAGAGSHLGTASNDVAVSRYINNQNVSSNYLNFDVTFSRCGNGEIDLGLNEQCDNSTIPKPLVGWDTGNFEAKKLLENICTSLFSPEDYQNAGGCFVSCNLGCQLLFCLKDGSSCLTMEKLCGNNTIDYFAGINYKEECDGEDFGTSSPICEGTLSCTTSCKSSCIITPTIITPPPILGPKVLTTIPYNGEEAFCRNGIVDIYFDSLINLDTLEIKENDQLVGKNIIIEDCGDVVIAKNQGIIKNVLAYFKNIINKLIGQKSQVLAQESCTPLEIDTYEVAGGNMYNKALVSLVTDDLLLPSRKYRVRIKGDIDGIRNLLGGILDNSNSPVDPPDINPENKDYIFEFKTMGIVGDNSTGICDVDWVDIKVYSQAYTSDDLGDRPFEFKNTDLFMCAGKDDCSLDLDFDQDLSTRGNQHIYQGIAKYRGGFSLKAVYQWSKTDDLDPFRVITLYNNFEEGDLEPHEFIVRNTTGLTFATGTPQDKAVAKLVVEAQAQGSTATPALAELLINFLLCENPWPSMSEKFPIASLLNAYNYQLYYCRDAGRPGDTSDDLPAAAWLLPDIKNLNILTNTDFEFGNLTNWVAVNNAFNYQPVKTDLPALRNEVYKSGIQGDWWINTYEKYRGNYWETIDQVQGNTYVGVLFSQTFLIEGKEIKFKIGGNNNPWPALGSEVYELSDSEIAGVTAVILATKASPSEPFIVRRQATGENTPVMREMSWDVSEFSTGRNCLADLDCAGFGTCQENGQCSAVIGIIYIYDNNYDGFITFDDLRQFDAKGVQIPLRF